MVDKDKLLAKINFIEDNLKKLKVISKFSLDDLKNDFIKFEAAKHLLQVSIEAMIDIANHIIARERLSAPSTSAECFKVLKDNGIISDKVYKKCRLMVKFRNRIVHIYFEVDVDEIYTILHNELTDFNGFISEIVKYINCAK